VAVDWAKKNGNDTKRSVSENPEYAESMLVDLQLCLSVFIRLLLKAKRSFVAENRLYSETVLHFRTELQTM
jgi:hypothetical protein